MDAAEEFYNSYRIESEEKELILYREEQQLFEVSTKKKFLPQPKNQEKKVADKKVGIGQS